MAARRRVVERRDAVIASGVEFRLFQRWASGQQDLARVTSKGDGQGRGGAHRRRVREQVAQGFEDLDERLHRE